MAVTKRSHDPNDVQIETIERDLRFLNKISIFLTFCIFHSEGGGNWALQTLSPNSLSHTRPLKMEIEFNLSNNH